MGRGDTMNVREFLDLFPILYADQPKRTAKDAIKEGDELMFVETEAGPIAVDQNGCVFRRKNDKE
jgi:hypothetical protein